MVRNNKSDVIFSTTEIGGNSSCDGGCGIVFRVTSLGVEKVLHSFTGGADGVGTFSGLDVTPTRAPLHQVVREITFARPISESSSGFENFFPNTVKQIRAYYCDI